MVGLLKWLFAGGLLYLLLKSGRLSLKDIQVFLQNLTSAAAAVLFCLSALCIIFFRWKMLLKSQGIHLAYGRVFQLGMLGQFFSSVIPGTVGGDLVKAVYIARRFPEHKVRVVSTIVMDRFVGLAAMIILAASAFQLGAQRLATLTTPGVSLIWVLGGALTVAAITLVLVLGLLPFLGNRLPEKLPERWVARLPMGNAFASLYEAGKAYQSKTRFIWIAIGISFFSQMANVGILFVAAQAMFGPFPWGNLDGSLFVLGSLVGVAAMSLPIAPMGLGVGQVAFAGIFLALGAPSDSFGASIVTGLQFVTLSVNLLGSIFFATYRHEVEASRELKAET